MLTFSLLLTGALGMLQERTYSRYGPCWKEGVFYTVTSSLAMCSELFTDRASSISYLCQYFYFSFLRSSMVFGACPQKLRRRLCL